MDKEQRREYMAAYRKANIEKARTATASWKKAHPEMVRAANAKYEKANQEKVRSAKIAWRKANPEKARAATAAWEKVNPEKAHAARVAWRKANHDKERTTTAAWGKAHPEEIAAYSANRRARVRNAAGQHTGEEIKQLLARQKCKCSVCKKSIEGGYERDHIVPLAKGGSNYIRNIQLLCQTCNRKKSAKHSCEFMREMGYLI